MGCVGRMMLGLPFLGSCCKRTEHLGLSDQLFDHATAGLAAARRHLVQAVAGLGGEGEGDGWALAPRAHRFTRRLSSKFLAKRRSKRRASDGHLAARAFVHDPSRKATSPSSSITALGDVAAFQSAEK